MKQFIPKYFSRRCDCRYIVVYSILYIHNHIIPFTDVIHVQGISLYAQC